MNVRSNVALWASTGAPPTNSASCATASSGDGASATSASLMCVSATMFSGMGMPGFTKVRNRSVTARPLRRAAAISVSWQCENDRPVVSVSRTMTSSSSRPNSSVFARSASLPYLSATDSGVSGRRMSSSTCLPLRSSWSCGSVPRPAYATPFSPAASTPSSAPFGSDPRAPRSSASSTSLRHSSEKPMPARRAASGMRELAVMPGTTFVSSM